MRTGILPREGEGDVMAGSGTRHKGRILVIDDERAVAEMIRDILRRRGFQVETSAGGEAALRQACDGDYHLVISDFAIPGMNGLEFARRFHAARPSVRVLIVSAFVDGDVEDALAAQPNVAGFLRKPFDIFDLIERVEAAVGDDHQMTMF